jgi:DNA topoisomerase-2
MTTAAQYKKHTHREHILELPDTYIGSVDTSLEHRWIWDDATGGMTWRAVQFCPGFHKIFDEVLVNALDHRVRMMGRTGADCVPVKHIDVTLTPTLITVRNDGDGVPVDMHPDTGLWAPELIFGNLLTSSNYDKSEEKIVGGKNGYGAKLTNIFSKEFTVESVDHRQKKKYVQTWNSNMTSISKAKITASNVKPYTEIRFMPDLARFSWGAGVATPTEIPADMLAVIASRVIDAAACASKDCKVSLNGKLVTSNTFPKYIGLYLKDDTGSVMTGESVAGSRDDDGTESVVGSTAKKARAPPAPKRVAFEVAGTRWEIGAILTRDLHGDAPPDERHISFVNGIATRRGGKHVEYVSKKILGEFCELAKKKAKIDITPALLKDSVVWFINSTIVNPCFDTQTKETLTTPASKFGSMPEITSKFCDQLVKIGLMNEAHALMDAKISRDAKRTDGRKKSTVRGIPKLDDAEWAGTAKSTECTLILTEGDSAKTLAIAGLAVVGRQKYGVFPLKGKILNVKDISADKKLKNQELTYIKQILGLETGKVYTDVKQLRYGKLMIMTDQDVDGSHIKGLLMNLFHTDWPSLLKLGFLCCLMTPLLKATKGRETRNFYSASEFEEWKASMGGDGADSGGSTRGWKIKYYKGLGTSTAAEGREYFESMNSVEYIWNDLSDSAIDLAFNKKRADDRKEWLGTFDRTRHLEVKSGGAKVDYSRFVHDELIHFSNYDNIRSLPHVMDGLKPSQRKIFWAALKKNLTSEIKVAQLAGYVSEVAAYHHGEASLNGAIVNMAQNFVGSNNLNLLVPNGQFGTRLMGGEDSAAPRYIFTELNKMTRAVVKKEDDPILVYTEDDGQMVEPETYLPVVPLLLINGALGIGTGFSTNVLPYNPVDIVGALKYRLSGATADLKPMEMTPWWFGFRGKTFASTDGKTFTTKGIYEFLDDDACTVRITELPVGCWTQDYKDFLEEMLLTQEKGGAAKKDKDSDKEIMLRSYTAAYNDVQVDFTLHLDPDYYHTARSYVNEFESKFKLCTTHKTTNMVAFNVDGKIRRFGNVGEILETFYKTRLTGYIQRRLKELERLSSDIMETNARLVFVRAVVEKRLVIANADDEVLLANMRALELPPLSSGEGLKGYEYLLRMRIDRLKATAVAELEADHANLMRVRAALEATTAEQLWLADLDEFSAAWTSYTTERAAAYDLSAATVKPSKARAASKKPAAPRAPRKPATAAPAAPAPAAVKNTIVM